jgi:hypothetical protein
MAATSAFQINVVRDGIVRVGHKLTFELHPNYERATVDVTLVVK